MFTRYVDLLDNFSSALEKYPMKNNETFEDYFVRLMNQIHRDRE